MDAPRGVVPLFPLPDAFLFPRAVMPLHVFEPRYREMMEHVLDRRGRLVIGTVSEEHVHLLPGAPPVRPVAGLGRVDSYRRLPDGRFVLQLVGEERVRVHEVESPHSFRLVETEPWPDEEPDTSEALVLRARLREAVADRGVTLPPEAAGLPCGVLADVLIQTLPVPPAALGAYFAESVVSRRAALALEVAARARRAEGRDTA
jgi:Lon protease-like protein